MSSIMAAVKQATAVYDGSHLQGMFAAATHWLETSYREIDALNVFPVPDGDTGTNMLLTMRSCIEAVAEVKERAAGVVAGAMARGALMGARGNSGVILSQFFRGLAQGLEGQEGFTPAHLARALTRGSELCYQGLSRPVEGTMLTVIREAAAAAQGVADREEMGLFLEGVTQAAAAAVARTPEQLPVLRQAGVVDAGGQGFYVLLQGALSFFRGGAPQPHLMAPSMPMALELRGGDEGEEEVYGYCTEFLLQGEGLDADGMRQRLAKKGKSLIVVGDAETVRVHIHTRDPGAVLRFASRLGSLHQILIHNMDDQHREFQEMRRRLSPPVPIAVVAVTWGEGMGRVFHSLGATAIVPGAKTMNPSTQELLRAVEVVPSQQVLLLPNNPNVIAAASLVPGLTNKKVWVVPTESQPQGLAALLSFNPETPPEANTSAMDQARHRVTTLEVTWAVRPARLGGIKVKKGQAIALLEGELVAAAASPEELLRGLLPRLRPESREVITLYWGADASPQERDAIARLFQKATPGEVEVVEGGQPHYCYIISLE